jgi:energy-converting hydrogenase Eha subunit H
LKTLETERKTHKKAANVISKKEVKVRQALANLASLSNSATPVTAQA